MKQTRYAPIALFIYKRPVHTRRTIEALMRCSEFAQSPVYVFCDGPRQKAEAKDVGAAREVALQLLVGRAEFVKATVNRGLASSIITGVSRLCAEYGRVIVVEDDLVVTSQFLTFLNMGLDRYAMEDQVMQISGHMFPVAEFSQRHIALFLPFTTSWGWGTWQRAWKQFDEHAKGWEQMAKNRELRRRFDLDNRIDYLGMLKMQVAGKIDSWAIRWYWSVFKAGGLVLFPPQSYVENIGFDGSGTHGWRSARNITKEGRGGNSSLSELPADIAVQPVDFELVKQILSGANQDIFSKLKRTIFGQMQHQIGASRIK